jgi:WD40 repeat protein
MLRRPGGAVRSAWFWPWLAGVTAAAYLPPLWLAQGHPNETKYLEGHTAGVTGVTVSSDGRHVLSASHDGTLRLWSVETAQELRQFDGHRGSVVGLALSPDGRYALSCGADDTVRLWDVATGAEVRRFAQQAPTAVAFSPDGRLVLTGSRDCLRAWDARTGQEVRSAVRAGAIDSFLIFSPDGLLAVGTDGADLPALWDTDSGEFLRTFQPLEPGRTFGAAFSPDGRRLLSGWGTNAGLWDVGSGRLLRQYRWRDMVLGFVTFQTPYGFSPDGRRGLTGVSNVVVLFDVDSGEELRRFRGYRRGHRDWVTCVAFTPDGAWAVSGSRDTTLRLWRLPR